MGDKVLALLPIPGTLLSARYSGSYVVSKKLGQVNYVIDTPDRRKSTQHCHVYMLKEYHNRAEATLL